MRLFCVTCAHFLARLSMRIIPFVCTILLFNSAHAASGIDSARWEYLVKPGDSLWTFADQHLSSAAYVPRLQKLNRIADPYRLTPGSRIKVPYAWVRQQPSSAQIEEFSGEVSAHDAAGKPMPISKDIRYPKGVQFHTGNDAMLKLRFADGSTLLLNSNTTAQLQNEIYYPSTGSARTEIKLDKGNTSSAVIPNILMPGRYQIRTPSAVTTVRGTEFRVSAETADSTATEVLRGKVNVNASKQGQVDVPAGFGAMASANAKLGQPQALPAAPDLSSLPTASSFNPPLLHWQADQQAVAYRVSVRGPGEHGKQIAERTVQQAQLYAALPENGEYRLSARARNATGLEGYDSSRSFTLQAYPQPPLLQAGDGVQEIRGKSFSLRLNASPTQPLQWQLSRTADFASISLQRTLTEADSTIELPDKGAWFWRVARLDAKGQPGPYSDTQAIQVRGLFSALKPAVPSLLARRYPVAGARYTLTLSDQADMKTIRYRDSRAQPVWPLAQLPQGRYFARLEVSGEHGYQAIEAFEEVQLR